MNRDAQFDNRGGQPLRASAKNAAMQTPARVPNTDTTHDGADIARRPSGNRLVAGRVPLQPSDTKTHSIRLDSLLD